MRLRENLSHQKAAHSKSLRSVLKSYVEKRFLHLKKKTFRLLFGSWVLPPSQL